MPTLYCLPAFVDAHPELVAQYPVVAARITGVDRPRRVLAENTWLARRTRSADVVHHGGGTVPTIGSGPIVLTIHDLQYLTYPEYLTPVKLRYLRIGDPAVDPPGDGHRGTERVRQVGRRRALRHRSGRDRRRPPRGGTAPRLRSPRASPICGATTGSGPGPVLVFPAITHPHKGHRFLLEVMARTWTDPDLRLVLLGGSGAVAAEVDRAIVELGLGPRIIRPGRVPAADRDGLIALAEALVFPSEYEGFGAPVVEAMALGTPVVCSDQAALAEVVGDAGIVLPRTVDAWAEALDQVARRRPALVAAGRARAADFTIARSGAALAEAYRAAHEHGR